jgi:hypothetical protein
MTDVVSRYDRRAGVEADLKSDKRGLALAVIRKRRLAAQRLVVLLIQLAHNVLLWARQWLAVRAPCLRAYGIVRRVQEVWAIPGRVKLVGEQIGSVRLRRAHPRARDVCCGFRPLLASSQPLGFWR